MRLTHTHTHTSLPTASEPHVARDGAEHREAHSMGHTLVHTRPPAESARTRCHMLQSQPGAETQAGVGAAALASRLPEAALMVLCQVGPHSDPTHSPFGADDN